MLAAVVNQPGGPEVLEVRDVPRPELRDGWALVRIRAFGLNRSELFTRQGHSPGVRFPRILGIECTGEVAAVAPNSPFTPGQTVAAVMGGMGRDYDGGYAEYALLPEAQLMPLRSTLPWSTLGALPETYLTADGSLAALDAQPGQAIVIRAATSSVGMAALQITRAAGLTIIATTRSETKAAILRERGADHVILEDPGLANAVRALFPGGVDAVLDLIGGRAILDSLALARPGGTVCNSGILSHTWVIPDFEPLEMIPSGVKLTIYRSGGITGANGTPRLQRIIDQVEAGSYTPNIDRIFPLGELVAAHRHMEENRAVGKIVVTT